MNTRLWAGFLAIATASLLAMGCGSSASYTETEDDHVQSDDAEAIDPGLEIEGFTETDEGPNPIKPRK